MKIPRHDEDRQVRFESPESGGGRPRHGFTLVELLVVITIIGVLVALLLPAVQAAREAARQLQCKNQMKQIALACLQHEAATRRFPTGGWGYAWTGEADRGNDWRQPGGWIYNILPYIEQQALHDMGAGLTGAQKQAANTQRLSVPVPALYCPSRRPALAYPRSSTSGSMYNADYSSLSQRVGRNDYAGNGGDYWANVTVSGVWGWAGPGSTTEVEYPVGQMTETARFGFANIAVRANGIFFCGSQIRIPDIKDGTSSTYLFGEKFLAPNYYTTGQDYGDNEAALMGDDQDICRWAGVDATVGPPLRDIPAKSKDDWSNYRFGSSHANGFGMAFCDGSVQSISYSIDLQTHRNLANRRDRKTIDSKAF